MTTDASKFAIGAVLSQDGKPVCYASRTLNPCETNYSVTEKELLSIVWSVRYFRPYLFGRHFKIRTDHKPLKWLDSLKEANSKLTRWKFILSEYDYEVDYIKGKDNVVADALSRNPPDNDSVINEPGDINSVIAECLKEFENHVSTVHSAQEMPLLTFPYSDKPLNYHKHQVIIKISESSPVPLCIQEKTFGNHRYFINLRKRHIDTDLENFITSLHNNVTYHIHFPDKHHEKFFIRTMQDKIIQLKSKLFICPTMLTDVVTPNDQKDKINYHHIYKTGHRGITSTVDSLKKNYYWPNMNIDVTKYINNCLICQKSKYERTPNTFEFSPVPIGTKPFERIHVDTLSISSQKYLTIIDTFSKFAQAYPLAGANSVNILDGILTFVSHYGLPHTIVCDNGAEFQNNNFINFCQLHKVTIHFTTPKNPNSNSYIERFHSTLIEQVRIKTQQNAKEPLNSLIQYSLLHYNNSVHSATNFTPFEVISGHFGSKDPYDIAEKDIISNYVHTHREKLQQHYAKLYKNITENKTQQLTKINASKQTPINITTSDQIYHKEHPRHKLDPRFSKIEPTAQTSNKVKTESSKYSKHNLKRRKNC